MTAAAPEMILKCDKTGKIFFTQAEATKHAEEIGAANFSQLEGEAKIWIDAKEQKKIFYSEDEIARFKQRIREPGFETKQITVLEWRQISQERELKYMNDPKVVQYCKNKIINALVDVKGVGVVRAEKATWFTMNKSLDAAEKWIASVLAGEAPNGVAAGDIDKPLKLEEGHCGHPEGGEGTAASSSGDAQPMDVDAEGSSQERFDPEKDDAAATENGAWLLEALKARGREAKVAELESMGFAKIRAEKALFFVSGDFGADQALEKAIEWLSEKQDSEEWKDELDKPLTFDRTAGSSAAAAAPAAPKMSKEEAERAALELQARIKKEREAREKQEAKDREKARIESEKLMRDAAEELKEEQVKRDRMERDRLKKEHEAHKAQLKEQLRLDYIDRHGCEPPAEEEQKKEAIADKPAKQQVTYWVNTLKKQYAGANSTPEDKAKLKLCLNTIKKFAENAKNNPTEGKFHKIKKGNKAVQERIIETCGKPHRDGLDGPDATDGAAVMLIRAMGFKDEGPNSEDGQFFAIQSSAADGWLLGEGIKFMDLVLGRL